MWFPVHFTSLLFSLISLKLYWWARLIFHQERFLSLSLQSLSFSVSLSFYISHSCFLSLHLFQSLSCSISCFLSLSLCPLSRSLSHFNLIPRHGCLLTISLYILLVCLPPWDLCWVPWYTLTFPDERRSDKNMSSTFCFFQLCARIRLLAMLARWSSTSGERMMISAFWSCDASSPQPWPNLDPSPVIAPWCCHFKGLVLAGCRFDRSLAWSCVCVCTFGLASEPYPTCSKSAAISISLQHITPSVWSAPLWVIL